jgi:nucleobase:cation symporter-1, NCS1 family
MIKGGIHVSDKKNVTNLEEDLAKKYNQPKNVEQYGIEQIPDNEKNVKWYDLFLIIVNFLMNPAMILIGGSAVAAGLSFWAAVTAVVAGVAVAYIGYIIMATLGVDHGVPGAVASRMTFGFIGSRFTASLVRLISSIYWFAFQTIAGAAAIVVIFNKLFNQELTIIPVSLFFAIFQVLVATFGYQWLKGLSRIAFPLKVVGFIFIIYAFMNHSDPNFAPGNVFGYEGTVGWQWGVFIVWVNSLVAVWMSMITDAADFCRYSRTRLDMWIGTMLAAIIGTFTSAFIGAYSAAATLGKVPNGLEGAANIVPSSIGLLLLLVVVILDNWTINVSNLYTGALCVTNMIPKLGRFWATLGVSVIGVALSLFPGMLDKFLGTMDFSGTLFASIGAVLITDYVFIKRGKLIVEQLYIQDGIYKFTNGWNIPAVVWSLIGFAIYNLTPPAFFQSAVCMIVTGIGYYLTQSLTGRIEQERQIYLKYSA